jgi:hypothetical protein
VLRKLPATRCPLRLDLVTTLVGAAVVITSMEPIPDSRMNGWDKPKNNILIERVVEEDQEDCVLAVFLVLVVLVWRSSLQAESSLVTDENGTVGIHFFVCCMSNSPPALDVILWYQQRSNARSRNGGPACPILLLDRRIFKV